MTNTAAAKAAGTPQAASWSKEECRSFRELLAEVLAGSEGRITLARQTPATTTHLEIKKKLNFKKFEDGHPNTS